MLFVIVFSTRSCNINFWNFNLLRFTKALACIVQLVTAKFKALHLNLHGTCQRTQNSTLDMLKYADSIADLEIFYTSHL